MSSTSTHPQSYRGHSDYIFALAYSPDGQYIASGGRDRTVHIWDAQTRKTQLIFAQHPTCILSLAWSPDGKYLASGCTSGIVYVWEAATGRIETTYKQHVRFIRSVSWSPDGSLLASGGEYGDSTVQIWEPLTGKQHYTHSSQYRIFAASWSPDGSCIASASFDGLLQLWQPHQTPHTHAHRASPLYTLSWSADSCSLVTAGQDGDARVWARDRANEPQCLYTGHTAAIKTLAYAPNGQYVASGGDDKSVQMWSPMTGETLAVDRRHTSWVRALAWSPDSRQVIAASTKEVRFWEW